MTPLDDSQQTASAESEGHSSSENGQLTITVENEDTGRDLVLHVGRGETVQKAIDELYRQLGRGPDPEDRLTCVQGGVDVKQFAAEKLKAYIARCPDLDWRFVGRTGGAGADER